MEFDHVILPVSDLDTAAVHIWDEHGLGSIEGGRHPGHGTANRLIPLGPDYLELVAVVDADEAASSPFGSWVEVHGDAASPRGLCLRSSDLDGHARRLGLQPVSMSRTRADGVELHWRLLGVGEGLNAGMPFFIDWDVAPSDHPGSAVAPLRVDLSPSGIAWVEIGGDGAAIEDWIGPHELDLRVVDAPPGVHRVALWTNSGDMVI